MRSLRPLSALLALAGLGMGLALPGAVVAQGIPPGGQAAPAAGAFTDDGDPESLRLAVTRTLVYLRGLRVANLRVAGRNFSVARLRTTCERFLALLDEKLPPAEFDQAVRERFEVFEAPGHDGAGSMHLTGYHLPLLEARRRPDAIFRFPLYAMPNTVTVNLGRFKPALAGQSVRGIVRGGELMPMPTRSEIDDKKVLSGLGLEVAYVSDELGRNAVMVQGSGLLRFEDGRIENLNYAGQNGYPYVSLGTALVRDGVMQSQGLTYPKIEAYFAAHPEKLHGYLARNASYVFFKLAAEGPFGCTGVAVVPGRSIATDQGVYPGGLIGHLSYPRAAFGPGGVPLDWGQGGRFVAGHDTGGAIRGPGRIDVYWGGGQEAAWRAGTMNGPGRWRLLLWRESPATPEPAPPVEASPEPPPMGAAPSQAPPAAGAAEPGHAPVLDQVKAQPSATLGSQDRVQPPPSWLPAALPLATAPPAARALPTPPSGFLPPAAAQAAQEPGITRATPARAVSPRPSTQPAAVRPLVASPTPRAHSGPAAPPSRPRASSGPPATATRRLASSAAPSSRPSLRPAAARPVPARSSSPRPR